MKRQQIEMVDGRVYFSSDGWEAIWLQRKVGPIRKVTSKKEADLVRFLAAMGAAIQTNDNDSQKGDI